MDITSLTAIGLSEPQATAYAAVIERGVIKPPELATIMAITRTNAYKLLDKLTEFGLISKLDTGKVEYRANNPMALSTLTAQYRAEAVAREEAAKNVLHDLLAQYHAKDSRPDVRTYSGVSEVANAYRVQIQLQEDIHFIHTRSDVLAMGYDTMHEIRVLPAHNKLQRQAIMTAPQNEDRPISWKAHERSNLHDVSWAAGDDYTAPVEWSVTSSSLLIVSYGVQPHAVLITDPLIAGGFLQLWSLLRRLVRQQPPHAAMQAKAD